MDSILQRHLGIYCTEVIRYPSISEEYAVQIRLDYLWRSSSIANPPVTIIRVTKIELTKSVYFIISRDVE
jgi:hypothetical protein